jgi:hypothetical protein
MAKLLRLLFRTGFKRGFGPEGGRGWLMVGIAAGLLHFFRRHHDEAKVTYSEKLQPGQTMIIRHYRKGEPLPPV